MSIQSPEKMLRSSLYGKATAAELTEEVIQLRRRTAETRALLFRMDPTPERLNAWANAYALLPESDVL